MGMPPLPGEAWFVKNGRDLVHSFVYCAAVLVAPRAEMSGDVFALYPGPVGDAEAYRFVEGGDLVLEQSQ
jgi:hypothetical protein